MSHRALLSLLPALLPLLSLLAFLPLLTLLSALTLLPILLLTVLGHLLHLALQLFCLTAQHLLLPALLHGLRVIALLLRQLLLPSRQGIELRQSIVDGFRLLVCSRPRLRRLVLILLRIQFKIEQAGQVAARTAASATTTAALLAKRYLYFAEGGFCAQQILQRFLLRRDSVVPLHLLQLVGRWSHRRSGRLHVVPEAVEFLIGRRQIPAIHARREGQSLFLQLGLHAERNLPASAESFVEAALSFWRFQVAAINSFSRFEMSVWFPIPPPPPPPPPICCDCENSRSNGSAWINAMSVRASACPSFAVA